MSDPCLADFVVKAPVIFVPGEACDERIFHFLRQSLTVENSAFVPLQWATDSAQMSMLCEDRLHYFTDKVHLVGFALGGYVAAQTAILHPARVASLTLINASVGKVTQAEMAFRKQKVANLTSGNSAKILATDELSSDIPQWLSQMEQDIGLATLAGQYGATKSRKNLLPQLAKQRFPVYSINGQQDPLQAERREQFASLGSAANSTLIKQGGAYLPLEQPQSLAKQLGLILRGNNSV